MVVKLNVLQVIGIWLMVMGLIMNTVVFIFSYYKIITRLKQNEDETKDEKKDEEKKSFPILRLIFHFRKILRDLQDSEKRENFELIIAFLKWILVVAVGMIVIGLLLFLFGFLV